MKLYPARRALFRLLGSNSTVRERILLHLLSHHRPDFEFEVPQEFTQGGIAESILSTQHRVSRTLAKLTEAGLVEEDRRRVAQMSRRMKVYFVTRNGIDTARELATEISARLQLPVGEPDQILEHLVAAPVIERPEGTRPTIFGRERQFEQLEAAIGVDKLGFVAVFGPEGIGKSALINRIGHHVIPVGRDPIVTVAEQLGAVVFSPQKLVEHLVTAGPDVLVLDDVVYDSSLIAMLEGVQKHWEAGLPCNTRKIVLVGRDPPTLLQTLSTQLLPIEVPPLDEDGIRTWLESDGRNDEVEEAIDASAGNPLLFQLWLNHGRADLHELESLHRLLVAPLTPSRRNLLEFISLFQESCRVNPLLAGVDVVGTDILALQDQALIVRAGRGWTLPGIVRKALEHLRNPERTSQLLERAAAACRGDVSEAMKLELAGFLLQLDEAEEVAEILLNSPGARSRWWYQLARDFLHRWPTGLDAIAIEARREELLEGFGPWDHLLEYLFQLEFGLRQRPGDLMAGRMAYLGWDREAWENAIDDQRRSITVVDDADDRFELEATLVHLLWYCGRSEEASELLVELGRRDTSSSNSRRLKVLEAEIAMGNRAWEEAETIWSTLGGVHDLDLAGRAALLRGDRDAALKNFDRAAASAGAIGHEQALAYIRMHQAQMGHGSTSEAREIFSLIGDQRGQIYLGFDDAEVQIPDAETALARAGLVWLSREMELL